MLKDAPWACRMRVCCWDGCGRWGYGGIVDAFGWRRFSKGARCQCDDRQSQGEEGCLLHRTAGASMTLGLPTPDVTTSDRPIMIVVASSVRHLAPPALRGVGVAVWGESPRFGGITLGGPLTQKLYNCGNCAKANQV